MKPFFLNFFLLRQEYAMLNLKLVYLNFVYIVLFQAKLVFLFQERNDKLFLEPFNFIKMPFMLFVLRFKSLIKIAARPGKAFALTGP